MEPRDVARADQILAILREADTPFTSTELYTLARSEFTRDNWTWGAHLRHLNELRILALIATDEQPCCLLHSLWALPADR